MKKLCFFVACISVLLLIGCAKKHEEKPLAEEKHGAEHKEEALVSAPDWIYSLAINPVDSKIVYAATSQGVYVTVDGGKFWCEMTKGLINPNISTIAIHPQNPDIVYAGGDGGVFKSKDRDTGWEEVNYGLDSLMVKALSIDPNNPETIYVGCVGDGGLFRSRDGGESWSRIGVNLPINIQVMAMAITKDSHLYIAGWQQGIFESRDGEKWERKNIGLESLLVRAIAINPIHPEILYVGTQDGIFGSIDGGERWKRLTKPPNQPKVWTIAIDPLAANVVYLGAWLVGISCSYNFGEDWERRNQGLLNTCVHCLAMDPNNSGVMYAGTEEGVYKSSASGLSWTACGSFGKIAAPHSEAEFVED
ncbi:MAG: YCF48-related protein [bacterium]|nr:YCF48-related protein [bacterium]